MVHIQFDTKSVHLNNFQVGYGLVSYYTGLSPYQRGYGFHKGSGMGSILKGLWRFLLPVIQSPAVKELGHEGLKHTANILTKVSEGKSIKDAAIEEGTTAAQSLLEKGIEKIKRQRGSGLIRNKSIKGNKEIRFVPKRKILLEKPNIKNKQKRIRSDAFGFY